MISPISPQPRCFEAGVSCAMVTKVVERILGEADEGVMKEKIECLLEKVWGKSLDFSLLLFLERRMVVALPRRGRRKAPVRWCEAINPDLDSQLVRRVILDTQNVDEMISPILAITVVKHKGSSDQGIEIKEGQDGPWLLSRSAYVERMHTLLRTTAGIGFLEGYTHAIVKAGFQGVSINIKRSIFEKLDDAGKRDLKSRAKMLEEVCGIPEKDIDGRARKVRCDISVLDKNIKERVMGLSRYVIQRKKTDREESECLQRLAKRIARQGITKECMEVLNEQCRKTNGEKTKGCTYRIGAFIPNAGILLQYTHAKGKSEACGWYPLKFGRLQEGACTLNAVRSINTNDFGCKIIGTPLRYFRPRLLCFLIHKGKKKIINGEVYDLKVLGEEGFKGGMNLPQYHIIEPYSNLNCNNDANVEKESQKVVQKPTKGPKLPVQIMMQNDKIQKQKRDEEVKEVTKQNSEDADVSSDGSEPHKETIDKSTFGNNTTVSEQLEENTVQETPNKSSGESERNIKKNEESMFRSPRIQIAKSASSNSPMGEKRDFLVQTPPNPFISKMLEINDSENTPEEKKGHDNNYANAKNHEQNTYNTLLGALNTHKKHKFSKCTNHGEKDCDETSVQSTKNQHNKEQENINQQSLKHNKEFRGHRNEDMIRFNTKMRNERKNGADEREGSITPRENSTSSANIELNEGALNADDFCVGTSEDERKKEKINKNSNKNTPTKEGKKAGNKVKNIGEEKYEKCQEMMQKFMAEKINIDNERIKKYNDISPIQPKLSENENKARIMTPQVNVTECNNQLRILINLKDFDIIGKEINIQIIAPNAPNTQNTETCIPMQIESSNENAEQVRQKEVCEALHENERGKGKINKESEKEQQALTTPQERENNIFEEAIKNKNKRKMNKKCNVNMGSKSDKKIDDGDLPVIIHRKETLDIYNTGKKSVEIKHVKIDPNRQWFEDEWYKLFDKKEEYKYEGATIRKINQRLKEKFIMSMASAEDGVIERLWLNLSRFLAHPNQKEIENMFLNTNAEKINTELLATSQFYKGAWGKSYKTLLGINERQTGIEEGDVEKLFPSIETQPTEQKQHQIYVGEEKRLITTKDVKQVIKSLPNGKAVGMSGISYEVIRSILNMKKGREGVTRMYNKLLFHPDNAHPQMYTSRCVGIPKRNGGIRPLCVQEAIVKPLHKIIGIKIERIINEKIEKTQKCLSMCEGQIKAWEKVMRDFKEAENPVIIQFDYTNAFGTISRKHIIERLLYYKIPGELVHYIDRMLARQRIVFKGVDGIDRVKRIETGVPQGEPLSMLLFSLGIDQMLQEIEDEGKARVTAYADDVILVAKKEEDVEELIETFVKRSQERGLSVNMAKTKIGFKGHLNVNLEKALIEMGIEKVNIEKQELEYLSLPITLNKKRMEEYVKERTEEFIGCTETLWDKNIPTQMKFHLQELCINSKMVYLYKAIPLCEDKEEMRWMKELQSRVNKIWKRFFGKENKKWWRVPIKLYGLGLFHIADRRKIARWGYEDRRNGATSEEGKIEIWRKFYCEKMEKWKRKRIFPQLDTSNIPPYINTSLLSPPTEHSMKMDDLAFRMMVETRYCSGGLDLYKKGAIGKRKCKCSIHGKPWTLQHILSCPLSCNQAVRSQHDQITQYICGILLRSHKVENVVRERKTIEQEKRAKEGKESKRADITYWRDGKQHAMDISVTTSWSSTKWKNPIRDAQRRKEKDYSGEKNVHIMLFDTAGGITAEAWKILLDLGASSYDMKRLQAIIHRSNAKRYQVILGNCKNEIYQRERRKHLEEKGKNN